jgi:arylsulfatase A-like enzyme
LQASKFRRALLALFVLSLLGGAASAARRFPNILVIAVDTLRADRLSGYGYARQTSPAIDRLMERGARYTQMRVVEPLTAPSMVSIFTSLYPHEHGATRNGVGMRPGLPSLGKVLGRRGYATAALVGNWTLRAEMCGLGEHFEHYGEVFTRKRWLGLFNGEATANDLTSETLDWITRQRNEQSATPFFVWAHYADPHAPYRLHREYLEQLGLAPKGETGRSDQYDTEIAFVDDAIGTLLEGVREQVSAEELLVVFVSDHGESLGEHGYWGHGRHLYEPTLNVPFSVPWYGQVAAQQVDALASSLDLAPTVLGLIGLPIPETFQGHDWSSRLRGEVPAEAAPAQTFHQAHKGATRGGADSRRKGLLEVGIVSPGHKEIASVRGRGGHLAFALDTDPKELRSKVAVGGTLSEDLAAWLATVRAGLLTSDQLPTADLDAEAIERLKALGYLDH